MSKLHKNKEYLEPNVTVDKAKIELEKGLHLLNTIEEKIVTFFGSHTADTNSKYYADAKRLAFELGKKKYAILSGGGPGIMKASNEGAIKAQTKSIGLVAELLENERVTDDIYTDKLAFKFLFTRRFIMSIKSEALIFYPGGYGTLNELFEYAVLMQTGIVDTVPIICVGKEYWKGLFEWLQQNPLERDFFIYGKKDLDLIHFVDTHEEVLELIP